MKPRDIVDYLFLTFAWGLSFLVLLKVVHAFGWVGAVTLRALLAGALLFVIAVLSRRRLDFSGGWLPLAIVGATTVAGQLIGLSFATPRIGTAMAAIFVAAVPLFSMLIGQLWGHEPMTRHGLIGLVVGFMGLVLLVGFPAVEINATFAMGCVASVFGALCSAFGSNYVSRNLRNTGTWEVTIGSFLFGGALTLPLLLLVPVPTQPVAVDYLYLLILGGGMSALSYVLYFRLVTSIGATRAISVEFAVTVIAVMAGAVLLGERLSVVQCVGAGTIILGCALVLGFVPGLGRHSASDRA